VLLQTELKALHLRHPENGPCEAEVLGGWIENGHVTGYKLRFSGETNTRHLRFGEIQQLQK
jgi:hypothetical protein